MSLKDYVSFVKDQVAYHERQAAKSGANPSKQQRHRSMAATFDALCMELESLSKPEASPTSPLDPAHLALKPSDLIGLPKELLAELNISDTDQHEFEVASLIEQAGGVMSLDQILIALFKKTGEIHKRKTLNGRLYRMSQKKLIYSVPGKKGVYSSYPLEIVLGPDSNKQEEEELDALE